MRTKGFFVCQTMMIFADFTFTVHLYFELPRPDVNDIKKKKLLVMTPFSRIRLCKIPFI